MNNISVAFITGLTTGGVSCLAVQGGLLASGMSQVGRELTRLEKSKYIGVFLAAKVLAYTLLGFLLGLLGSRIALTPQLQGLMQILAGLFMLATAGRLANIHPIFRYFVIEPPKWAFRLVRSQAKSNSAFANAILGFLTVLIPCGVTQSMMVLAIAAGSPWLGAGIMFAFTLGTSPVFFALGMAIVEILKKKALSYVAALAVFVLGILSLNTGQVLRGSPHTLQNYYAVLFGTVETSASSGTAKIVNGKQRATINVLPGGYKADTQVLKAGVPVVLDLVSNNVRSCARAFTIPSLNISKVLPQTGTETLEFTPTQPGRLAYTCSMGMYTGEFLVK